MVKSHNVIYHSKRHLIITLIFVIAPFLFLLVFSNLTHIAVSRLFLDLLISFWRLLGAYLAALVIGWSLAAIFFKGKGAVLMLPVFDVLQSFPTFAALPLAASFWGVSNFTIIFFLVITVIWPIFFSIVSSLKLVKREWEEAAEIYGLKGVNYFTHFLLPASTPGIITGSIIGLGEGWEALVGTEIIIGIKSGLGEFFSSFAHDPVITSVGIMAFLVIIFSVNKLVWLPLLEWSHRVMES